MANEKNTRLPAGDEPEDRETRESRSDSREHESRVDEHSEEHATHPVAATPWVRPSSLEAPEPRPGMVQRWIRISVRGAEDPRNINMRTREGWRPRPVDTIEGEFSQLGTRAGVAEGRFIVDDLMLCEMPRETYAQQQAYYEQQTAAQMRAVEQDLEDAQVPGQPIVRTHKTTVSHPARAVGRRAEAAEDI